MLGLFVVALGVRLHQHHAALLYPDGYQYLLMARGIGEHLQPTTVLGPGGDEFVPSPDAAVKPLFPLLVAGVHALGLSWLDAARLVTATAGALAVAGLAVLATRLSESRLAGLGAGMLLLASPSVAFWSGFSGPDPLAMALALWSATAYAYGRPRVGGVLSGLAISARPELAIVGLAAAIVSLRRESNRRALVQALPAAVVTTVLVFGVLRTPIAVQDWRLVWLAPLLVGALALIAFAPQRVLKLGSLIAVALVGLVLVAEPGPAEVWAYDWPLVVIGVLAIVAVVRDDARGSTARFVLGALVLLGCVYVLKNPTLGRYFSLLLPAVVLLAALGAASLPRRLVPAALGAMAVVVVAGFLQPVPGSRDYDMFSAVARSAAPHLPSVALVTAAPDAYGFLLPGQTVYAMSPGRRGAVLLDAAQRLYLPGLTARGRVVARVGDEIAFARPDGEIDAGEAVVVLGRVVEAHMTVTDREKTAFAGARRPPGGETR